MEAILESDTAQSGAKGKRGKMSTVIVSSHGSGACPEGIRREYSEGTEPRSIRGPCYMLMIIFRKIKKQTNTATWLCTSMKVLLLMGLVFCTPATLLGDGGVYPSIIAEPSDILIPAQQAAIVFDGAKETLILQIQFKGEGESFAWLVPVPSRPEVDAANPGFFSFLESISQPKVVTSGFPVLSGILAVLLLLSFPFLASRRSVLFWAKALAAIIFGAFVLSVLWTNSGPMGSRGIDHVAVPGVMVHEAETVGPYDIAVLSSDDPHALALWFKKNEYFFPEEAAIVIREYVLENWYFVVCRLSSNQVNQVPEWQITPLELTFATHEVIYPLRLTSSGFGDSHVLLYTLGRSFFRANGFRVEDARKIAPYLREVMKKRSGMDLGKFGDLYLTKLHGRLSPAQMKMDAVLTPDARQEEFCSVVYTKEARRYILWITVFCLALVAADLCLPMKFHKKLPFACLVVIVMLVCRPWVPFVPSRLEYHERTEMTRSGVLNVRMRRNMYEVHSALKEYSTMAKGYYPANLNVTVREVLEQLGHKSGKEISLAGAKGCDPVFQGEIGSSGLVLLREQMRNLGSSFDSPLPILATSTSDPPTQLLPGLVLYVPLEVDRSVARGYKVYCVDVDGQLFEQVCSSMRK